MIVPVMIACKERYVKLATLSIETYLRFNQTPLFVVTDATGMSQLKQYKCDRLHLVPIADYKKRAEKKVRIAGMTSYVFQYDKDGLHDRAYSGLKPVIMDDVAERLSPSSKYVLSLDSDTIFTGDIIKMTEGVLSSVNHQFDLYLVARTDPRMLQTGAKVPGSGYTLWKRKSKFIGIFCEKYHKDQIGARGGSQDLINKLSQIVPFRAIQCPSFHFVSPDLKNPELTDEEILSWKDELTPGYVHLHGANSYDRLIRFKKLLIGE